MKTRKTIIAASIAALLVVPLTVSAKAKWDYHEDQWNEVISYGNVSLAEDSAQQWGPWSEFVQPAAGGPSVVFLPQVAELYRPVPVVLKTPETPPEVTPTPTPTPTDFCKAGEWCGYAIYRNTERNTESDNDENGKTFRHEEHGQPPADPRPYAGFFALMLNPDNPPDKKWWISVPGTVSWRAEPLPDNVAPTFGDSGGEMDAKFWNSWWGAYPSVFNTTYGKDSDGYINSKTYWWGLYTTNKEVAAGVFNRYVSGDRGESWSSRVDGFYVAGVTTPQAYLSAQRLGDVTATYCGNSIDITGHKIPVHLTVNFGNATWGGSWNNGRDASSVKVLTDAGGNTYLVGGVGFTVLEGQGKISGANLSATNLTATDGTVSGKVQASFYGQTAGSVGGVTDIVKSTAVVASDGPNLLSSKPAGYTNASNVQVFVADKVPTPPVSQPR